MEQLLVGAAGRARSFSPELRPVTADQRFGIEPRFVYSPSAMSGLSAEVRAEVRQLLLLAGPLIAAQLSGTASNFVDAVMAGRLGAEALGAVAVGASTWMTLTLTSTGVLGALSPSVAQLHGAGRLDEVAPLTRQSYWIAMVLALISIGFLWSIEAVFVRLGVDPALRTLIVGYSRALSWGMPALCGYLVLRLMSEGLGIARPAMYFGILGIGVNVAGNYALMFGRWGFPELGVVGCGHATAAVAWAQFLGFALYVSKHSDYSGIGSVVGLSRPERGSLLELLRVGLPIGGSNFVESSLFSSVAYLMATLGALAVAAHQIAINFVAMTFMVPLGLSMAITVRVGHARGLGNPAAVRRAGAVGMSIALMIQTVSATLMVAFPWAIVSIYTDDRKVASAAVGLLFLAALFQLSDGLQVSAAGALRGLKDTRVPMLMTVLAYWVIGLPLGYILGFELGMGARGMWVGLIAGLTVAAAMLPWRFRRLAGGLRG